MQCLHVCPSTYTYGIYRGNTIFEPNFAIANYNVIKSVQYVIFTQYFVQKTELSTPSDNRIWAICQQISLIDQQYGFIIKQHRIFFYNWSRVSPILKIMHIQRWNRKQLPFLTACFYIQWGYFVFSGGIFLGGDFSLHDIHPFVPRQKINKISSYFNYTTFGFVQMKNKLL